MKKQNSAFAITLLFLFLLSLIIGGCSCGGGDSSTTDTNSNNENTSASTPSQPETIIPTATVQWEEVSSPGIILKFCSLNEKIFAVTSDGLFKSDDFGMSWQPIDINLETGSLNAMCIDQNKLYIACRNGITVSDDEGVSFQWSFHWTWDACNDIDMQGGYGWAAVINWGGMSGPIRKTPDDDWFSRKGDIPYEHLCAYNVTADPLDPLNIAYAHCDGGLYRTLDGGEHWLTMPCNKIVIYITIVDGMSVIYSCDTYSKDYGATWQDLGCSLKFEKNFLVKDDQTGLFYGVTWNGILSGHPGEWTSYGLESESDSLSTLGICKNWLLVYSHDGKIFRTNTSTAVYHQNLP